MPKCACRSREPCLDFGDSTKRGFPVEQASTNSLLYYVFCMLLVPFCISLLCNHVAYASEGTKNIPAWTQRATSKAKLFHAHAKAIAKDNVLDQLIFCRVIPAQLSTCCELFPRCRTGNDCSNNVWHRGRWRFQLWPMLRIRYKRVSSASPPGGPPAVASFHARAMGVVNVDRHDEWRLRPRPVLGQWRAQSLSAAMAYEHEPLRLWSMRARRQFRCDVGQVLLCRPESFVCHDAAPSDVWSFTGNLRITAGNTLRDLSAAWHAERFEHPRRAAHSKEVFRI